MPFDNAFAAMAESKVEAVVATQDGEFALLRKANTMAKENAPVTVAQRELLPIKSTAVTVDVANFRTKSVVVDMDDALTPQDISDNPTIWRTVQKSRDKALNALDHCTFVWHDRIATAIVDYADPESVQFCKTTILQRKDRDREPFNDGTFAVRSVSGMWAAFRISDNVRMGGLHQRWEASRQEIWTLTGVRVA
jgi:hypothetical protein